MTEPNRRIKKPNVVFLFTDDQRHDTIAALGNSEIRTPNLDNLVTEGTAFTSAHIMGGTNGAVCMPSREMLMTGRTIFHLDDPANPPAPEDPDMQILLDRHGGEAVEEAIGRLEPVIQAGRFIPESFATMPETFRSAGYRTYHVGKCHEDRASFNRSFCDGARIFGFTSGWYETYGGHWNVALHDYDATGKYPEESGYMLAADHETKVPIGLGAGGVHSSELFADAAVDFLEGHDTEHPFFLYLSFVAPHDPRQSPDEFEEMYQPADIHLPPNYLPQHPFDNGDLRVRDECLEGWPRGKRAIRDHIADYYAIISHADAQIGRVIQTLKDRRMYENTIIVFAGDNGLAVGQHGLMGKQSVYEHSTGVPLIFAGPGVPKGERRDALCYLLDIYPTLCDLTGVVAPATVEGLSLVPTLGDPGRPVRDSLFFAYKGCQRAVRDARFKLIEYVAPNERNTQLFDLQNDPWEIVNIIDNRDYSVEAESLREELARWRDELEDNQRSFGAIFWAGYCEAGE